MTTAAPSPSRSCSSALGTASGFDPVSEPDDGPDRPGGRRTGAGDPGLPWPRASCPTTARALALLFDDGVDGSLVSTLGLLVDAAYSVREQLSADTWQLVGDIEEELARLRRRPPDPVRRGPAQPAAPAAVPAGPGRACAPRTWSGTRPGCSSTAGAASSGPSPWSACCGPCWCEQRAGVVEDLLVESLLKTSESLIIFRRRSGSILHVAGALDLLVYDVANPRSVLYQLDRLVDHLAELPKQSSAQRLGNQERLALEATTLLRLTDADRLAAVDPRPGAGAELDSVFGHGRRAAGRPARLAAAHLLRP